MPRFLILRFSSIGDIVLTTPVIRCLKQQVPGAEIHFLTRKVFEPVVINNPHIDRIHTFSESPTECLDVLNAIPFDAVIDLHHNQRTLLLKSRLKKPTGGWFAFRKLNIEKWLLVNLKMDRLPRVHIVDRYLETVRAFGVSNDGIGLDYFIQDADREAVSQLPASHQNGYHVVAIGAQHATKRLPIGKLIAICRKANVPIILLGGKEDADTGYDIARSAGQHVISLCGKLSLNSSAAIIEKARTVLSHDTGLMHIAAAFRRPIISVWGNTVPQFGMTPYYGAQPVAGHRFEVEGLSCRPCTKIGHSKCPKAHFKCMMDQDAEAIADRLTSL